MSSKSDLKRYDRLQQIGCIACIKDMKYGVSPDIHHLVEGNKRLGNKFTLPLCPWHHRGVGHGNGPSLALNKKAFVAQYGTERELLKEVNEKL